MKMILCSTKDTASMNVRKQLIEKFGFKETDKTLFNHRVYEKDDISLITLDTLHIFADEEMKSLTAELIVVASRHVSEAEVKALLAHPVGNWGEEARYGGRPNTLTPTSAHALYVAVSKLKEKTEEFGINDCQIGMEATHHGPYSESPLLFIELGSTEKEWNDEKLAEIVAEACIAACEYEKAANKPEAAIGFGGGHYAPKFTPLVLRGEKAFGHVAAKYGFPMRRETIEQAFKRTVERPKLAYIDWKGIKSEYRHELLTVIEEKGYEYVRV